MKFNPKIHHRRSIRLKGYDYSKAGLYFITICCQDRKCWFGEISDVVGTGFTPVQTTDNGSEMILNEYGEIAYNKWTKLPERFSNFELDVFQIMPNHMHGIMVLNDLPLPAEEGAEVNPAPTRSPVGNIVGAYKSLVANECLKIYKQKWADVNTAPVMGKLWQRNYYEHIIRTEQSYHTISNYIINNPSKWREDKFFQKP